MCNREAALLPLQKLIHLRAPYMSTEAQPMAAAIMHKFQVSGTSKLSSSVKGAVLETLGDLLNAYPQVRGTHACCLPAAGVLNVRF